ncbi:MAG: hypothetical protein JWN66_2091 [Sphingomonas bacterium]|jgi:hypothetical protein|uniref:hypothetical protein n=1 Tax=Sphingomonas bacterium TaxID=1895847 RepID=UPI00262C8F3F|nr:hypothetical protein [Sphingomonas bacterium]MDB5704975.1 hypothetical protein [Sphingomonas bacterium]
MRGAKAYLWGASALLTVTAALHFFGWFMVRSQLAGETLPLIRLFWFTADVDWLVVAAIWFVAGRKGSVALRPIVLIAAITPLASAAGMILTLGPTFFGLWMLAIAVVLAVLGARRLV